jgi:hypothetical protein
MRSFQKKKANCGREFDSLLQAKVYAQHNPELVRVFRCRDALCADEWGPPSQRSNPSRRGRELSPLSRLLVEKVALGVVTVFTNQSVSRPLAPFSDDIL